MIRFNEKRVHEIGPDLAALEWLMECGATQVRSSSQILNHTLAKSLSHICRTQVEMSDGRRIGSQREMRAYVSHAVNDEV